jgi:hypothetical protein
MSTRELFERETRDPNLSPAIPIQELAAVGAAASMSGCCSLHVGVLFTRLRIRGLQKSREGACVERLQVGRHFKKLKLAQEVGRSRLDF